MCRYFAIVPAAGKSTRMGEPKLLMPMNGGTMIEQTLAAWRQSRVEKVIVVVRPGDQALANLCRSWGAEVVVPPAAPPEMKDSVQYGLQHIAANLAPSAEDAWLLAPADMPNLSPSVIEALLQAHDKNTRRILIPTLSGKRGHPVLFPWSMAREVYTLSPDEGLNVLRKRHQTQEIPCDSQEPAGETAFRDVDTPEDYDRIISR